MNPCRVYVVEHEELFATELRDRLDRLGYVVCGRVDDGEKALEEILLHRPDLVLLDIHLAGSLSGIETARRLRPLLDVPAVFLCALPELKLMEHAIVTGSFGHLVRPFEERELHATLQAALYKHRSEALLRSEKDRLEAAVQQRTAELMSSEARLRDLFDGTSDLIQSTAPDGRVLFANRAWRETLGYNETEIAGLNLFQIVHPDCLDHCRSVLDRLVRGEDVGMIDVAFVTRDGRRIELEGNVAVRRDRNRPIQTRGIFRDVTARRAAADDARRALERRAAFQHALLELRDREWATPASFFRALTERVAGALQVGRVSVWLFDTTHTDLVCHDLWQAGARTHEAGLRITATAYAAYFAAIGREESILADDARTDPRTADFKTPYLEPFGVTSLIDVPIRVSGRLAGVICCEHTGPARHWEPDEGKFAETAAGYAMLVLEQAERRRAEAAVRELNENLERLVAQRTAALRESETRLKEAQRIAHVGHWESGPGGELMHWSEETCRIFGLDPAAGPVTEAQLAALIHPDDRDRVRAIFDQAAARHERFEVEYRVCRMDGAQRIVRDEGETVFGPDDRPAGLRGIVQDVTEHHDTQRKLRESEALYRALVEASTDAVFLLDATGHILTANQAAARMHGMTIVDLVGRHIGELDDPADREAIERAAAAAAHLVLGETLRFDIRHRHVDGRTFPLEVVATPIQFGGRTCVLATERDITVRKLAEIALRESEEKFRGVFDKSPIPILLTTVPEGAITEINEAALRTLGFERAAVLGATTTAIKLWKDPAERQRFLDLLARDGHVTGFEAEMRRADGAYGSFLLNSSQLQVGADLHTLTSMLDVTERRLAQEALAASEARYRILVESSNDGILLLDGAGRILAANTTAAAMHGYTREEIMVLPIAELVTAPDARLAPQRLELLATGERLVFEAEHRRKDGSTFPVEVSASPLVIGAEPCILVNQRDITGRKAAEAASHESEEKFRTLFDDSPVPMVLNALPGGRIVDVNAAALRHFGYTREEVVGRTSVELRWWAEARDRDYYLRQLEAVGTVEAFEAVVHGRDGRPLNILHDGRIVNIGGQLHAINTIRDITQQRRAEQEMSRLALLAKETDNSVVIADLDRRITWTNDGFSRLTGYAPEDVKGTRLADLLLASDADVTAAAALRAALATGENTSCDLINHHKSGEPYWMHLTIQAMHDRRGEITGFFSTAIDITDRKLTELSLKFLATGVVHAFGSAYFQVISAGLARLLGTDHGFVCTYLPGNLSQFHAYGHWRTGSNFPGDPQKVRSIEGKACAALATQGLVLLPDNAAKILPDDALLQDRAIAGYAAIRLNDEEGQPIGFIGVMGRRRLGNPARVESLLRLFAVRVASELSRQQTEAKFHDLFEFSPDAVLIADHRLVISDANLRAVELFGYRRDELVGQSAEMLMPAEHRAALLARLHAYAANPQPSAMGTSAPGLFAQDKSGRTFPIDISLSPLQSPRGLLTVAAVRDITAHVRAEELAAATHRHTAALARLGRELAETTTMKAAARLLLQIANELLGWDSAQVFSYHRTKDRFSTLASFVLVDGQPREVTFAAEATFEPTADLRHVMQSGAQLAAPGASSTASAIRVPIRVAGRLTGVLAIHRHPSAAYTRDGMQLLQTLADYGAGALARIQALDQLRASEERLRLVWDSTNDGMRLSDSRRRIVAANSAYCRMLGTTDAKIVGTLIDDLYEPVTAARVRAEHETWFSRRELPAMRQFEPVLHDGRQLALEAVHAFVETGGEPLLLSAYRDISARRLAERERELMQAQLRQSQKMEAIGTLAGGIAHDFNNILSAIITHTDLLRIDLPPAIPGRENVEDIAAAAERARRLVQQILTFSRQGESARQPIQLGPVIEEVQRLLRATLPAMVKLHYRSDPDCPSVNANSTQIHQVVMNLCTNAWQALPASAGNIRLDLECCVLPAAQSARLPPLLPGRHVRLNVTDDGIGMDEATLARIFDPFFTTKKPGEGTGLGLSMVHGIMKGHAGAIAVTSAPGRGTTFSLYFPIAVTDPAVAVSARPVLPTSLPSPARLLLVDDEQVVGGALKKLLTRRGFTVTHCTTPEEALALCREEPGRFDLMISDQLMPGMSGLKLAAAVHGLSPRMPIVIQSGHVSHELKKAVGQWGIRTILQKPVASQELCDIAVHWLGEHRS